MRIGVPAETARGERRVAIAPDVIKKLVKGGNQVLVESQAGFGAGFSDEDFIGAGAEVTEDFKRVWAADIVLKVQKPGERSDGTDELSLLREGSVFVSFLNPLFEPRRMQLLAERKVVAFAMETIPRTTRAQSMDALSSQANIAGYKAVLKAADRLPKLMPMLMTAAGTIQPAKVFILGAGVAGLQAIATARRLGAVVSAFDVRSAVKEQIQSLGAKFVEIDVGESGEGEGGYARQLSEIAQQRQRDGLGKIAADMDIILTTAAIPGQKAPRLIERAAVEKMRPGTVIIDMAASTGGNVEGAMPDEEVTIGGATLLGPTNLPAEMPRDASQVYARNLYALLELMLKPEGKLEIDWNDDILAAAVICREGELVHPRVKDALAKAG
ncbi:MAG: Re/Si-specific NAD(P)(+) transhydrogenase subunit alpha [Myxococcota bacterium]